MSSSQKNVVFTKSTKRQELDMLNADRALKRHQSKGIFYEFSLWIKTEHVSMNINGQSHRVLIVSLRLSWEQIVKRSSNKWPNSLSLRHQWLFLSHHIGVLQSFSECYGWFVFSWILLLELSWYLGLLNNSLCLCDGTRQPQEEHQGAW